MDDHPAMRRGRMTATSRAALLATALALVLAAPAAAYDETDAARARVAETGESDVVAVWHEPAVVQPSTQWHGFIQFAPGANVTAVRYQICHVGYSCFAPPTPAQRVNATTWTFDTNHYLAAGSNRPVDWQAGWRVGMKFILDQSTPHGALETAFPNGTANPDSLEFHYLAFNMPPAAKNSPAVAPALAIGILLLAAALRRR